MRCENSMASTQISGQLRGSALDIAAARPVTRLEAAHNEIESAVNSLREQVNVLAANLASVLRPSSPAVENLAGEAQTRSLPSPAVDNAERLTARIRGIEQTVNDLLQRLEA